MKCGMGGDCGAAAPQLNAARTHTQTQQRSFARGRRRRRSSSFVVVRRRSSFVVRRSSFIVPFIVRHSAFVCRSSLIVYRSSFIVRRRCRRCRRCYLTRRSSRMPSRECVFVGGGRCAIRLHLRVRLRERVRWSAHSSRRRAVERRESVGAGRRGSTCLSGAALDEQIRL